MIKFLPILALLAMGVLMWQFSAWRLRGMLEKKSEPLDDPTLEAVVRRLGRAVGLDHLQARVFDEPSFNGLASPDGRIYVTRGVLDQYRLGRVGAEEIGSIIAHELGHVALGHTRRRMIDWSVQNALRWGLILVLGRFVPFVGVYIAHFLTGLIAARLSRRDEFEADAYAAALMRRAGVTPGAQLEMFRKLGAMSPEGGGQPVWLLSHPPLPSRIAAVEALHEQWDAADAGGPDAAPSTDARTRG